MKNKFLLLYLLFTVNILNSITIQIKFFRYWYDCNKVHKHENLDVELSNEEFEKYTIENLKQKVLKEHSCSNFDLTYPLINGVLPNDLQIKYIYSITPFWAFGFDKCIRHDQCSNQEHSKIEKESPGMELDLKDVKNE